MLSEYFVFLFAVYTVAVIYALVRVRGRGRHLLLWIPVCLVGLVALTGPAAQRLGAGTQESFAYLYYGLIAVQWNRHIWAALGVCLGLSVCCWILARSRKKPLARTRAAGALALLFLAGGLLSGAARRCNFPYARLVQAESETSWTRQTPEGIRYYPHSYDVAYGMLSDLYMGTVNADIPIYALPNEDAEVIAVIPEGTESSLMTLNFSYALLGHAGWRYAHTSINKYFSEAIGEVSGYIRLSDALSALARGQDSFLLNCLARERLLLSDDYGYGMGYYTTPDFTQLFIPLGVWLSLALAAAAGILWALLHIHERVPIV